jgi:hypothetical protein
MLFILELRYSFMRCAALSVFIIGKCFEMSSGLYLQGDSEVPVQTQTPWVSCVTLPTLFVLTDAQGHLDHPIEFNFVCVCVCGGGGCWSLL